jgi:hypothetical protein
MRIACGHHVLGPQRAHVQPERGAARAAVIAKCDRALFGFRVLFEIRHVKHARHRRRLSRILGRGERELRSRLRLAVGPELRVLRIGRAHRDDAGDGVVLNVLPAHIDRALRGYVGLGRAIGGFFGGLVRRCSGLVGGRGRRGWFLVLRAGGIWKQEQPCGQHSAAKSMSQSHSWISRNLLELELRFGNRDQYTVRNAEVLVPRSPISRCSSPIASRSSLKPDT